MKRLSSIVGLLLVIACGSGDDTTTEGASSSGSSSAATTGDGTGGTTLAPTTGASSGEALSSTGEGSSTAAPPACETAAADCGVSVSDEGSSCPDPQPATNELVIEVLGPGQIKISEVGYDSACNISIDPEVKLGANHSILVVYGVQGSPMDGCVCKFTITATLSDLPPGTWTVQVGPHSQTVEVP